MITINIYQDNELKHTAKDQPNDMEALRWLLRNQGQSTDWALRFGGWKVELIDQDTGEKDYWKPYSQLVRESKL